VIVRSSCESSTTHVVKRRNPLYSTGALGFDCVLNTTNIISNNMNMNT
jgi:hypothetical protein